jgi:two-component system, NarL family, invasion response regulator UvrY
MKTKAPPPPPEVRGGLSRKARTKDSAISVCIVGPDSDERAKLHQAIHRDTRFVCFGVFEDAKKCMSAISSLKPNVLVMNIVPGSEGSKSIRRAREIVPCSRIVVWRPFLNRKIVSDAVVSGAAAVLEKHPSIEHLLLVHNGEHILSDGAWQATVQTVQQHDPWNANPDMLSEREYEVALLMRNCLSTKEIALRLGIAFLTAQTHVRNILRKTKTHGRRHALAIIFGRNKAISPHEAKAAANT